MGNIKNGLVILLLFVFFISACQETHKSNGLESVGYVPNKGERYSDARDLLIKSGWTAVKANCGEKVVCFDLPELATYLELGKSCGSFKKGGYMMQVCIASVSDDSIVESVTVLP